MFTRGKVYTHKNMLDVCFRIKSILGSSEYEMHLWVEWLRKSNLTPFELVETIYVFDTQFKFYKELLQ